MIIKIDTREPDLLQQMNYLISTIPVFKNIIIQSETLPIGDIIITDGNDEKLIIERKSVSDLLASIKDGRYEEQSYRLNGTNYHNHNIIYLIEGDVSRLNRFKPDNRVEKLTLYSAMFSLNYYKGFSVFRSFTLDETALIICNMAYKLEKDAANKQPYYKNITIQEDAKLEEQISDETEISQENNTTHEETDKDYIGVVKKIKKDNITADNIDEIMLCQIPGISSVSAIAIIQKFKNLVNLIKELETNNDCLNDISYTNTKGQTRKINKTCATNIVKFLLKK
jgi:ERCC4-type nuclease